MMASTHPLRSVKALHCPGLEVFEEESSWSAGQLWSFNGVGIQSRSFHSSSVREHRLWNAARGTSRCRRTHLGRPAGSSETRTRGLWAGGFGTAGSGLVSTPNLRTWHCICGR
jgi:hypothetical protein